MEVSDIEAVLKFLRKNGFSEAELALRNDLFERHDDLVASDFEKFQFPLSPKLPPVRIQRKLNFSDDDDGGGVGDAASSSTSYRSDDFQSLSSSKGFTNPYGLLSTDHVSSDSSSDRLSQFGTARDYHDSDLLNDMFWHDDKGYIGGGGKDFFSCRSEDKFVTTSGGMGQYEQNSGLDFASGGFHSVTSINSGELLLRNNSLVDDTDDVVVKDCYHWYEASQRGIGDEAGLESGAENNCLVPVYDSSIGLEGLQAGESDNDNDLITMKELALIEGQLKTFGETPSIHDSTAGKARNESSSDKDLTKSDGEEYQKEFGLQLQTTAQPFQPYGDDGYESEDGKETTGEELHDPEVAGDEENSATPNELSICEHVEDEYEVFNLRIIHRKNRTGFEENKDMPIVLNSVIAGRYYVTEYLGSAAFSKVIQAHDLQTGIDVCLKIIKNDKDFFDQSLDEIKLLKFVNKHDPGDEHHILRLYDYFYHQEHLFIVCELLRANLYEFQKFNQDSGGEVYFTLRRLQSITRQCLEALEYLHCLGIIHCDLKPENILIKSYSRCEIKVIDLGSSCFESDNLCLYIQSRSYRAPEVILGLPYDQKIDLWSLGCILAELCSGEVLFPNEALVVLLSRIIGMFGLPDMEMLVKGQETHKYFIKEYDLYHMNEETNQMECIIPEETSLEHHLQVSDIGFIEFVKDLLEVNPSRRPTASEALQHPWLSYPY
ncbi:dual specificity tyrosine-phosphorylation-regulated kinase mbk-2-like isoform X1 [Papaver somniferum]|uniref:dual specificity tyrosine-phosphorylation-regulated kinase mbk-2-like isoform X1 n=1 Tax=Papaver somniferum TaxID=3469 RepID=UPI000E705C0E|nr:dual specificity tyrosine-phosphorylation-regulated kinase mbk-2-like isoform X1 [Papaver somniferum]